MGRLTDKVAIVTGGASNPGLGHSTIHKFAEEGAKIVVTDIDIEGGEKTVSEIINKGGQALFIKHDVVSSKDWEKTIDKTISEYGKIDILVNNAGIALIAPFEDFSEDQWDKQINVNLKSVFLGCKAVIPEMKKNNYGSIINLSSIAGLVGLQGCAAYNASKGGVRLLTKSIAIEYGINKIRCNSIHPGFMATNMNDPKKITERGRDFDAIIQTIPLLSMGTAEDIANCALYLASDESSYVTGSEYVVDGGWTAK